MALTLTKEDGTGKSNANSYADVTDGDAYFEGHLYATAWTGATSDSKAAALVMATRLVDSQFQFNGFRANETQALQWPRERCPDPDRNLGMSTPLSPVLTNYVPSDEVPCQVVSAVCELARELLIVDRTAAPPGEGILSEHTSEYSRDATGVASSISSSKMYSKGDTRPIISPVAQAMLAKYGALVSGRSGAVTLVRA